MSPPIVSNCIVWGNAPNNFAGSGPVADISYSDIGGGWPGEGNIDVDPLFGDGLYHLRSSSPCVDAGDPTLFDASLPPGHGGTDSDMGAYGGTGNDAWLEAEIDLLLIPGETVTVPRGGNLEFDTLIWNSTANQVTGDRWLSVRLPNENELLIPDDLLNIQNPLTGTIPGNSSFTAAGTLSIPGGVATGEYLLIGRIGAYPNTVIDEESFWFHVVE